ALPILNSDLSSQVSEQQETTSIKQLSLAFHWGFQAGTFLHQCFVELGPQCLQNAQQWCLASQFHPLHTHNGLEYMPLTETTNRYTSKWTLIRFHVSQF